MSRSCLDGRVDGSTSNEADVSRIDDFTRALQRKGVILWHDHGQLCFKAPKGALSDVDRDGLRSWKQQIVMRLRGSQVESSHFSGSPITIVPLAFSQLAHWQLYRLKERPAIRQVASATRIQGFLDAEAFQKSVSELIRRHEALRTRIVVLNESPIQVIDQQGKARVETIDLTSLPYESVGERVESIIRNLILEPIDVALGPLFGLVLVRTRSDEHVLVLAMEHMISDGQSLNILLRDLFSAYAQILRGVPIELPPVALQFREHVIRQRRDHERWVETHRAYWDTWLSACKFARFPDDQHLGAGGRGWGTIPIRIDRDMRSRLYDWSRQMKTSLVLALFTTYVALVMRWCGTSDVVVQYVTDGRTTPAVEHTVGYFGSVLYLSISLAETDTFADLLRRVTDQYCDSYEHADSSFFTAQPDGWKFSRATAFNWVPAPDKQGTQMELLGELALSRIPFTHPMLQGLELDGDPSVLLYDNGEEITGDVFFPFNRFSPTTMQRFASNFTELASSLVSQPNMHVISKTLP